MVSKNYRVHRMGDHKIGHVYNKKLTYYNDYLCITRNFSFERVRNTIVLIFNDLKD